MRVRTIILNLFTLITFGCSGLQSTFRPWDITGGYGDEKLNDNVYMVFFDGNGFTNMPTVKKYFLRRASQIALKNSQDCFVVLDEKNTLHSNFMTNHKSAANTKFHAGEGYLTSENINKPDDNSLSGLIQLYKMTNAPANCINAEQTLRVSET